MRHGDIVVLSDVCLCPGFIVDEYEYEYEYEFMVYYHKIKGPLLAVIEMLSVYGLVISRAVWT
jgi:hypothetical protein